MTLVIDASFTVPACTTPGGFDRLGDELVAPPLLWPEARSVLHRSVWRGVIAAHVGEHALQRLEQAPVRSRNPRGLGASVWSIATELGWAKTYDAEYLALARLLGAPLLSLDRRMLRAAERLGITTAEL
ncbi:MAG TPA: type II toxin-antitoxin system VapC family toxin [Gaiellaceae bacterium]|nr:type II toxin-antitoxin system VapC family toxin [Gaiellaceae bacterium]